jgi:hypothetical protein
MTHCNMWESELSLDQKRRIRGIETWNSRQTEHRDAIGKAVTRRRKLQAVQNRAWGGHTGCAAGSHICVASLYKMIVTNRTP